MFGLGIGVGIIGLDQDALKPVNVGLLVVLEKLGLYNFFIEKLIYFILFLVENFLLLDVPVSQPLLQHPNNRLGVELPLYFHPVDLFPDKSVELVFLPGPEQHFLKGVDILVAAGDGEEAEADTPEIIFINFFLFI